MREQRRWYPKNSDVFVSMRMRGLRWMHCRSRDYSLLLCCTLQDGHLQFGDPSHATGLRKRVVKMETDERIGRLVGSDCDGGENE